MYTLTPSQDSCIDVQHKKRGRPRLREEDNMRDPYAANYPHPDLFPVESTIISVAQSDRPRSKSYRELRSQPDAVYTAQRPKTSDAIYYGNQQLYGSNSTATSSFLPSTTPTVLLTPDFVVAQHNRAFADVLALPYTARGWRLADLVVPNDQEKVSRARTLLRGELQSANSLYALDSQYDSRAGMPPIESLDVGLATSGFKTQSEYWTFRLPPDKSRGFPISITLARTSTFFVVLTLIQRASPTHSVLSPTFAQPMTSTGFDRRGSQIIPSGGLQSHRLSYSAAVPDSTGIQFQPSHSSSLEQYSKRSPPRGSVSYPSDQKTSSPESVRSSQVPYGNSAGDQQHLQLPPIRTKASNAVEPKRRGSDRSQQSATSGKVSPMSASNHSSRKKKRRLEIGEILH